MQRANEEQFDVHHHAGHPLLEGEEVDFCLAEMALHPDRSEITSGQITRPDYILISITTATSICPPHHPNAVRSSYLKVAG